MLSTVDLLNSTADFIHAMKDDIIDENFDWQLSVIKQESNYVNKEIEGKLK